MKGIFSKTNLYKSLFRRTKNTAIQLSQIIMPVHLARVIILGRLQNPICWLQILTM